MIPGIAAGVSPRVCLKYNAEVNKLDEELASGSSDLSPSLRWALGLSGRVVSRTQASLGPDLSGGSFGSHHLLLRQGSSIFRGYDLCEVRSLARTVP